MSEVRLEPGDRLDRFTVEESVGRGGMGVVYKIRDPRSKMPFAAKVLNPALAVQRDAVARFKSEAKTARRFSHVNIVTVLKLQRWRGTWFYVMELLEGSTLDVISEDDPPSRDRSLALLRDVAAALDHIHCKRYVHRDIKSGNVFLRADGIAKVIDFGLSQKIGRVKRTKSGHVLGTAKYMAPELIDGTEARPETDMYALGVMAYELLSGRPPFEAGHSSVIMDMHLYVKHKPLVSLLPDVDPQLAGVVDRMLVKDPSRRAASARALHAWLDFYLTRGFFADMPRRF